MNFRYQRAAPSEVTKMAGVLFEDIFNVKDIDPEGKKFDRGESETHLNLPSIYKHCCGEIAMRRAEFLSVKQGSFHRCLSLAEVCREAHGVTV